MGAALLQHACTWLFQLIWTCRGIAGLVEVINVLCMQQRSLIICRCRPAAAALGDSLKAEHHRLQPADGDGVRALKLLIAGVEADDVCSQGTWR
jgi:hypothetical protein